MIPSFIRYDLTRQNFSPDKWYPLQLFYDISKEGLGTGGKTVETAIGKSIAPDIINIYGIKDIRKFIEEDLNRTAVAAIRNAPKDFGYIITELGHQHYHVKINLPTPDYTVYGYVWEVIRLLKNPGEEFSVIPDRCFGDGDSPTGFEVRWGASS